jgi:hypothetical protein
VVVLAAIILIAVAVVTRARHWLRAQELLKGVASMFGS